MSRFLSKIKARLEPGQQYASEEAGWVRAALESMEQETKDVPIVEALSQGSPSSWQADLVERMRVLALGSGEALTVSNITLPGKVNHGNSSAQSASERLWETGNLDCSLPNGFYSRIPHEHPKVRPPTISTADSEAGLWDILLVDDRQDKTLVKLKEICLELVKGFEANTADTIRKIAGMVADFYGGPLFETGHVKDVALSKEHDSNVTLLGQVKVGLCRPRALLFKYLGDAVGLKNRLLLGLQLDSVPSTSLICSNPKKHLTNVVELNGKELLVDVMHHPGHLRPFTVKALVMYHISGPGDSDSADYDSCDSPLEPNSPLYFGPQERVDAASPSQSEPDLANPSWRHNRRKSISDERGNKSSPEFQSEVRYFQRRHMGDGARSFPSSPEHSQARLRSLRSMRSLGSNPSPEHTGLRARAPSMLSGSRRTLDEDTERASTSSPDDSPQYQNLTAASFRRRSSSFCVREGGLERAINTSSESRRVRKRTNAPEIGDDVVRAVRAMNEAAKQGRRTTEQEFQGRCAPTETVSNELQLRSNDQDLKERAGSEPNSLKICGSSSSLQSLEGLTVDAARISRDFVRNEIHASGSTVSVSDLLPDRPVMPYREWNIDFSELRIGIRVGIGSFGEVFRGTWRGTEVAVKIMLEQDLTRENTEDFFNEISLLSRLRHPNVILFMGACTKPPHLSMVTEYMHMGSLYRLIHTSGQGKKLSWRRRLKMLRDICRGMMCIQRMNIIHRDLKSANCLVDKHWCVKICDFGLSRLTDGDSPIQETTAAGTPEWMAPELLRNEPVSYKCDVFSLGVIMWELCTLKRPWEGVQPLQVVYEVSHKKSRLEVPEGLLGKLISDCWQENPQDRPSYDEILTRLHECDFLLG